MMLGLCAFGLLFAGVVLGIFISSLMVAAKEADRMAGYDKENK